MLATQQIVRFESRDKIFLGELALDGRLRPVNGALSIAQMAAEKSFKYIFLPIENAREASAIKNISIVPIENLREAMAILEGRAQKNFFIDASAAEDDRSRNREVPDFSEIQGQYAAKRALTVAAAGGHNALMVGPPGVGKSFLAHALAGILPELTGEEAIDVTKIWSVAGLRPDGVIRERPFRAPHQTTSLIALVGGGLELKPGEISLAHRGVLFLDELPEFQRGVLDALRQPLEAGSIHIARAKGSVTFPARFMLVAAMNSCPCGYYGDPEKECKCSAYEVIKYQKRISGPLLDRIDIQIKIGRIKIDELRKGDSTNSTEEVVKIASGLEIKQAVKQARRIQHLRFGDAITTNADMSARETHQFVRLERDAEQFLGTLDRYHFSPRSYYRLLKVARTIADLDKKESVTTDHLAEAFSYRLRNDI